MEFCVFLEASQYWRQNLGSAVKRAELTLGAVEPLGIMNTKDRHPCPVGTSGLSGEDKEQTYNAPICVIGFGEKVTELGARKQQGKESGFLNQNGERSLNKTDGEGEGCPVI